MTSQSTASMQFQGIATPTGFVIRRTSNPPLNPAGYSTETPIDYSTNNANTAPNNGQNTQPINHGDQPMETTRAYGGQRQGKALP